LQRITIIHDPIKKTPIGGFFVFRVLAAYFPYFFL
jgi:hypothetical protein